MIRETREDDLTGLATLYHATFPEEPLLPLVNDLMTRESDVLSLTAIADGHVIGHVMLTACSLEGDPVPLALLGPLCVTPASQRRGVGTALVQAGVGLVGQSGTHTIYVLGDPGYYKRFGFAQETSVMPPFPLVDAYACGWQSLHLDASTPPLSGRLSVPDPWRRQALWRP